MIYNAAIHDFIEKMGIDTVDKFDFLQDAIDYEKSNRFPDERSVGVRVSFGNIRNFINTRVEMEHDTDLAKYINDEDFIEHVIDTMEGYYECNRSSDIDSNIDYVLEDYEKGE